MPAGMELFPASDADSWSLIKKIIDDSDYYILILAGRYGSLAPSGISYTEMEYDYATEIKKPVIAFIHEDTSSISSGKSEKSESGKEKLNAFRSKVTQRQCKYWSNAEDLGGKVSRSLINLKKTNPSDGWVPGKFAIDDKTLLEIETLKNRVLELEALNALTNIEEETKELAQGDDIFSTTQDLIKEPGNPREAEKLNCTWSEIITYTGPALVGECSEKTIEEKIQLLFWHKVPRNLEPMNNYDDIIVRHVEFDVIKTQLQALGIITKGTKRRAVSDREVYWQLTPHGEKIFIKLSAIRKPHQ